MFRRFLLFLKMLFRILFVFFADACVFILLSDGLGSSIINFAKECGFYGWYFWPIVVILVIALLVCEYLWAVGYFSGENQSFKGHEERAARRAAKEREQEERDREREEERERRQAEYEREEARRHKEFEERCEEERIRCQARDDARGLIQQSYWNDNDFPKAENALRNLDDGQLIRELRAKMTKESLRKR